MCAALFFACICTRSNREFESGWTQCVFLCDFNVKAAALLGRESPGVNWPRERVESGVELSNKLACPLNETLEANSALTLYQWRASFCTARFVLRSESV